MTAVVAATTVGTMALAEAAQGSGLPTGAVRAASFSGQSGAQVESTGDTGGGKNVGWLANGDWLRFDGVDLGRAGTVTTSIRVAAAFADRPGSIEVRVGSRTGRLLASVAVPATGGWQTWATRSDSRRSPGGKQTLFLVMRSPQAADFVNVNWFTVTASATGSGASTPGTGTSTVPGTSTAPAGTTSSSTRPGTTTATGSTTTTTGTGTTGTGTTGTGSGAAGTGTPGTGSGTTGTTTTGTTGTTGSTMPGMPGMTSSSGTTGMTMTAPPGTWVPVDEAAWKRQLAAFEALTPRAVPANAKKNAEFNATCTYSHSASDDPIVFPGKKGASHLHSFIGNDGTDANTTTSSLMQFTASSCQPAEDHSAYWIPTLLEHGQPVEPSQVIVYYGSLLDDKSKTVPMPQGLRMIVGDAKKQQATPRGAVNQFYCAGGPQDGKTRSDDGNWPVCDGGTLHFTMRFPDCWDGKHLDSPNHKQHVGFGAGGKCTAEFPVPIPSVTFVLAYPTAGSSHGFQLSSGLPSSMHGDAFFAWEEDAMAQRVKNCVTQIATCNTAGQF